MKKLFPLRGYFVRARIFGIIVILILVFYLVYLLLEMLEGKTPEHQ